MNNSDLQLCYNASLTYIINKYQHNILFSKFNVTYEDMAIDVTSSLFSKNASGAIEINIPKKNERAANINESEFIFLIITTIKERVERAIKFEMLKYDLITIEDYNSISVK